MNARNNARAVLGSPVTFSLGQAALICSIDVAILRQWIANDDLVPAIKGGRGRGNAHRLSVQQTIGLTVAAWYAGCCGSRWLDHETALATIREYGVWPWSAVEQALGLRRDEYTEEALAKVLGKSPKEEMTPEVFGRVHKLFVRFMEIRDAVLTAQGEVESANRSKLPAYLDPRQIANRLKTKK
jgi:hypothetical protein